MGKIQALGDSNNSLKTVLVNYLIDLAPETKLDMIKTWASEHKCVVDGQTLFELNKSQRYQCIKSMRKSGKVTATNLTTLFQIE